MLTSPIANARQAGARQATVAALSNQEAQPLADIAVNSDPATRKGAAEVLSRNVSAAPERAYCETLLTHLFNDADSDVRAAAGNWGWQVRDAKHIDPVLSIAEAFVESPAFAESADSLFWAIEEAVDAPSSLLLRAGHRFVEVVGEAAGDLRLSSSATAENLSNLILRAYRQADGDPNLRQQCLDLFDRLLEVGGYGADEAIEAFGR